MVTPSVPRGGIARPNEEMPPCSYAPRLSRCFRSHLRCLLQSRRTPRVQARVLNRLPKHRKVRARARKRKRAPDRGRNPPTCPKDRARVQVPVRGRDLGRGRERKLRKDLVPVPARVRGPVPAQDRERKLRKDLAPVPAHNLQRRPRRDRVPDLENQLRSDA
jgi:hypothetical protein